MSATSSQGALVTYCVTSGGSALPDAFQVMSLHIDRSLNRIASARIQLLDGNAAEETFKISSSSVFVPGTTITVSVGYDGKNTLAFSGVISAQRLMINPTVGSVLEVECHDKAIKLTVGRKSGCYKQQTDSDVISTLIRNAGLTAEVTSTNDSLEELIQNYCSDWDFILSRAETNGMVVSTVDGTVQVFRYDKATSPSAEVVYGNNLHTFDADLNSVSQFSRVKASAWDYKQQKLLVSEVSNSKAGPGNLSSKKLASVADSDGIELQSTVPLTADELHTWAQAQMHKSEFSKILGELSCDGTNDYLPGCLVKLSGLGARFDGNVFVSAVTHRIEHGNWLTELTLGMDETWFVDAVRTAAPPASGLLPGISGLMNATVKESFQDPDGEDRILIDLPLLDKSGAGVWARQATFYASSGFGVFFQPEKGDEVIVGFLNEDPRFPVILGSVYSSKRKSWESLQPDEKNTQKGIVTASQLRILFDDEKKVLTIQTPAGNKLILDDDQSQISVIDQQNNKLLMSESGIDLESPTSISIKATESVSIQGDTGVTIASEGGDISISGVNVSASADAEYSASGDATASVEGGAELTLKAAMVMIN